MDRSGDIDERVRVRERELRSYPDAWREQTSFAKRLARHVALMIREGRTGTGHWIIPTMPAKHSSHGELLIELLPPTFPQRFT